LLLDPVVPLVTLTGPGGVGKTRLALAVADAVADSFADGTVFVSLAPVLDSALVLPAIAQALGVRAAGNRPLADRLRSVIRDCELLLVLDNLEQVLAAGRELSALLVACPRLKALVTSRIRLHVTGEQTFPVGPLALPERGNDRRSAALTNQRLSPTLGVRSDMSCCRARGVFEGIDPLTAEETCHSLYVGRAGLSQQGQEMAHDWVNNTICAHRRHRVTFGAGVPWEESAQFDPPPR
jgi:predicted ATPase